MNPNDFSSHISCLIVALAKEDARICGPHFSGIQKKGKEFVDSGAEPYEKT